MGGSSGRGRRKARAKSYVASHDAVAPVTSPVIARQLRQAVLGYANVVGSYIGHRMRRGRYTREPALVVIVNQKVPEASLPRTQRIPRSIKLDVGRGAKLELPTDVVVRRVFERASVASPGDSIHQPEIGTIGVAIVHPRWGEMVTTAGHVYIKGYGQLDYPGSNAPTVALRDRESNTVIMGVLRRAVVSAVADYALIAPASAMSRNVFEGLIYGGAYTPDVNDLGKRCAALTVRGQEAATIRGVNVPIDFGDGTVLEHAILVDESLPPGDSGCCLATKPRKIAGVLVGRENNHAAFMPIDSLLADERAVLC